MFISRFGSQSPSINLVYIPLFHVRYGTVCQLHVAVVLVVNHIQMVDS